MSIVWTPDNADPLILAQEDQTNVSATVSAESDDPLDPVTAVTWSAEPAFPPQFSVETSSSSLTVDIPTFAGVFQIQEIGYLRDGVPGTCTEWADLPVDAEDVITFRPDPVNVREHTLTVVAHQDVGGATSQDYIIRVFANYTLGRDLLVEAVDARRN